MEELASTMEIVATQQTQIEAQQSQLEAQQKKIDWLQSVVSNLVGISPPMDGTSATGLGLSSDRSVLRSRYRSVSSDGMISITLIKSFWLSSCDLAYLFKRLNLIVEI